MAALLGAALAFVAWGLGAPGWAAFMFGWTFALLLAVAGNVHTFTELAKRAYEPEDEA